MLKIGCLAAIALVLATAADAQMLPSRHRPICHAYAEIAHQLAATYDEAPVSLGLQSNGNLLQVFSSARTGSWTILSTSPKGLACVLAAGRNWEHVHTARRDPAA